jgi:hypothetical protein
MRKFGTVLAAASVVVAIGSFAGVAQAAVIYPVTAVGSSSYPGYNDAFAIDQGAGSQFTDWASFGDFTDAFLNLNLGSVQNLGSAYVTDRVTSGGGNGAYFGGTTDFTTQFSLTGFTDATFTTAIGPALIFSRATPVAPTGPASFQTVASINGLNAQYVQYRVLAANGGNTGLSDIYFTTAVPEPGAWALMLLGFGGLGMVMRRRRSVALAA